jgi:AraC-like DNA-binding protein
MLKGATTSPGRGENLISRIDNLAQSGEILGKSLQDICSELGVSRRLLERTFRGKLHISPARYLRTLALYATWSKLIRGSGTVTSIAAEYGFNELGRFSGQYKLLFGEHPSKTLERAKSAKPHASLLVVEDQALVAFETARALGQAEFEVLGPARSAVKALELIKSSRCDAAVLDAMLDGETAEQVARELDERGTPFIVLSAYAQEQLPSLLRSAPFLAKPLQPQRLLEEVRRCLNA